jgi:hypothetical protein
MTPFEQMAIYTGSTCITDRAKLTPTVVTPVGETEYQDMANACLQMGIYVSGIDPVFDALNLTPLSPPSPRCRLSIGHSPAARRALAALRTLSRPLEMVMLPGGPPLEDCPV